MPLMKQQNICTKKFDYNGIVASPFELYGFKLNPFPRKPLKVKSGISLQTGEKKLKPDHN